MSESITPGMVVEVVEDKSGKAPETVGQTALVLKMRERPGVYGSLEIEMMSGEGSGQLYYAHPEELKPIW
jgi:hypothetical protein